MNLLDGDALDALTEIFNIGIGRAASALADIAGHEVQMAVPLIELVPPDQDTSNLLDHEERRHCIGVRMDFGGVINASGVLVFAERGALDLVRLVTPGAYGQGALTDLEHEAISEIGNIMFNHWIGAIANTLGQEISSGLPVVQEGPYRDFVRELRGTSGSEVPLLLVQVDLNVMQTEIAGKFMITLHSPGIQQLIDQLLRGYFRSVPSSRPTQELR